MFVSYTVAMPSSVDEQRLASPGSYLTKAAPPRLPAK